MNSKTLRRAIATWTILVVIASLPAFGFRMIKNTTVGTVTSASLVPCDDSGGFAHWSNSNISWYLNTAGQGSGKATAIQNALTSWTNVADADHTLTYAGTTTAGWATDSQNTVLWASGNGCTGSCLALTALTLQSGQVIVEADVTFNSSHSWQTNGADLDTEAVAAHEFGHTLGIHHTELVGTIYPTMYTYYTGNAARWLTSDDIAALQCAHDVYFSGAPRPSAPPTPASFSVQPYLCYGWATFSWSSSTGATFYEIQQSSYSNFVSTWPVYAGNDTALFFDGGTGTNYYRVRACNSGGCSGYRNGSSGVSYHDPCAN
jgi:hypothetical protein